MTTINNAFTSAMLADACYVDLLSGDAGANLQCKLSERMTPTLAKLISDNFEVVTAINTPDGAIEGSGFDAVVWRGNEGTPCAGQLFVSMRGTEGTADFLSDASLAISGNARGQLVDMVNWWMCETTPVGEAAAQIKSVKSNMQDGVWEFVAAAPSTGTGHITETDLAGGTQVLGHSLGGYMASAFTRLFGTQAGVTQTSTFNSAGFAPGSESAFADIQSVVGIALGQTSFPAAGDNSQLNYFATHGLNLTTNSFWFGQVGQRIELFNEDSSSQIPNHFMYKLTDSLALANAMSTLDPTMTLDRANKILESGSNFIIGELEGVLDSLRHLLVNPAASFTVSNDASGSIGTRTAYHFNLDGLQNSEVFNLLAGKVRIDVSSIDLIAKARNDFSALASLITLSPVVLTGLYSSIDTALQDVWGTAYTNWQTDRSMSEADRAAGHQTYSDNWIRDRSRLLNAIVLQSQRNTTTGLVLDSSVPTDRSYEFRYYGGAPLTAETLPPNQILIAEGNAGTVKPSQLIAFGDDRDNGINGTDYRLGDLLYGGGGNDIMTGMMGDDYIEGNGGNDHLDGGAGADTLLGGTGNDILDGGADADVLYGDDGAGGDMLAGSAGNDTYHTDSGDTILDSSGAGVVYMNGKILSSATQVEGESFYSDDTGNVYLLSGTTLYIFDPHVPKTHQVPLTIKNFTSGDLGITLKKKVAADSLDNPALKAPFTQAESTTSPLVLDLDGNGITTRGIGEGAFFDYNSNGFAERTGWVNSNDGLLVRDIDGNGAINDGKELFGNNTELKNGQTAANGFLALADLDENGDGKVDEQDSTWAELRIWQDTNGDGVSQKEELKSLADFNIQGIGTAYGSAASTDSHGNQHLQQGSFVRADGSVGKIEDIWFRINPASTQQVSPLDVPEDIRGLPQIAGMGNVASLWQVMAKEAASGSTHLRDLIDQFANESDHAARNTLAVAIIYAWTGVEDKDPNSRAARLIYGNAIGDARKLYAMEALLGEGYVGTWCWGEKDPNPHGPAAAILLQAFDQFANGISAQLMQQTRLNDFYQAITYSWDADAQTVTGDLLGVLPVFTGKFAANHEQGKTELVEFITNLTYTNDAHALNTRAFQDALMAFGPDVVSAGGMAWRGMVATSGNDQLTGDSANDHIAGWDGNDIIHGAGGNDHLLGEEGDDRLYGQDGNDTLEGGTGSDLLDGGAGSDLYLFGRGDGQDTIWSQDRAAGKVDILRFGAGIAPGDIEVVRNADDLVLTLRGSSDRVTVAAYFTGDGVSSSSLEAIEFEGGVTWDLTAVIGLLPPLVGTEGNDRMRGYSTAEAIEGIQGDDYIDGRGGNDTLLGGAGSDLLYGQDGDDFVDGGAGVDQIDGGIGNDTLTGGTDNDTLDGGAGNDIYLFNQGDGTDALSDYDYTTGNTDTLSLSTGLTAEITQLARVGSNLVLSWNGADSVTLQNYFYSSTYRIENIAFADGTTWDYAAVAGRLTYRGTIGDDYMSGLSDRANRISGQAGNDWITGGTLGDALDGGDGSDSITASAGNDTLTGGLGNDTLDGGDGNDTYLFNQGDGADTVSDYGYTADSADTLSLSTGLTAELTQLARAGSSLVLSWNGADSVTLQSYFSGSNYRVENIAFADGTTWDYAAVAERLIYRGTTGDDYMYGLGDQANRISGQAGNDWITGGNLGDDLDGGEGNDSITASAGNDTLTGGLGNDTLDGGDGNDTYLFNQGDGADTVSDYGYTADSADTLSLSTGLTAELTQLARAGSNLVLSWNGADSVTLQNYFYSSTYRIENIAFADGTTWDYAAVAERLIYRGTTGDDYMYGLGDQANRISGQAGNDWITGGNLGDDLDGGEGNDSITASAGNDTLTGGLGNDTLDGGDGNDTYLFNQGDGADTVSDYGYTADSADTLSLSTGLTAELTQLARAGSNLVLSWNGADSVTLQNYFYSSTYRIENIAFADGTTWDYAAVAGRLTYRGTTGDDYMSGLSDQANRISGQAGNDWITGGTLGDALDGGDGSDSITASAGNDTLTGGLGNDTLDGGDGNDTYLFNQGDGADTVSDYGYTADSADTLSLSTGLTAELTQLARAGSNLVLSWNGADSVTLQNYFYSSTYRIENIAFADGTTWDYAAVAGRLTYRGTTGDDYMSGLSDQANRISGQAGNDWITGGTLGDALDGGDGSDSITASAGNDTLTGGLGNDTLDGGDGNDTYLFNQGDGADTVSDYGYTADSADTLSLSTGLTAELTQLARVDSNLVLSWNGADSVTLQNYFYSSTYRIENIAFADGTTWDYAAVAERLTYRGTTGDDYMSGLSDQANRISGQAGNDWITGGNLGDALDGGDGNDSIIASAGNDTLTGGLGNDTLDGGDGNDTYLFNQGDGADTVSDYGYTADSADTLSLSTGLTAELTQLARVGSNLVLSWNGADSVTLQNYFYSSTYRIENIAFADGTTWDYAAVAGRLTYRGTTGDDYMSGLSDQANRISGQAGNDWITGGTLGDALDGGDGSDSITASAGNDTLTGGLGNDTLDGGDGNDTYLFNQGDGADTVSDYGYTADSADTLSLSTGLTAELTQLARAGSNLVLSWNGADSVTLQNYFYSSTYRIENIAFADGTTWDYAAVAGRLTYRGTTGDDYMSGLSDQANRISGQAGNDWITGGTLGDALDGGDGSDSITASAGNDTLTGGLGNDTLDGGDGNDTYLFNQGDGADTVSDYGYTADSADTLSLSTGLTAELTQLARVDSNLVLSWNGADSVTLQNYFYSSTYRIENIAFADGTTWDYAAVAERLTYRGTTGDDYMSGLSDQANRISGQAGNDWITGGNLGDALDGGDGNDSIIASAGNDTLTGGLGNDTLDGGDGNDTYLFNQGDGADTVSDYGYTADSADTLSLSTGLTAELTQLARVGSNLVLSWNGADSVTLQNYFYSSTYRIENIAFADGTTWDYAAVAERLTYRGTTGDDYMSGLSDQANRISGQAGNDWITGGTLGDALDGGDGSDSITASAGNDTLTGGLGNDTLDGGDGNDTYLFNQGDGADTVSDYGYTADSADTLSLSTGLTAELTQLARVGSNLVLSWNGADSVTLQNYFYSSTYRIENIAFADGTTWDYAAVAGRLTYRGTIGDDYMSGLSDQANRISGQAGNDWITGGNLGDALDGGDGSDSITASAGNDTLTGGLGNDTLDGGDGNDTYLFNQGDGADTVSDYGYAADSADTLSLSTGLTAELTQLARVGSNLVLSWNGADSVTLQNYFYSSTYRIENIAFADGTTWDYAAVAERLTYRGTIGDDYMSGLSDQANRISGQAGNDWITGGTLGDDLDGGEGNDSITASAGNDTLTGGLGNDTLDGSNGSDTYLFNQGDGVDTVSDYDYAADSADTLSLGTGLTAELTQIARAGSSLVLSWNGADSVTLQSYFSGSNYRVENIAFADGTTWDYAAVTNRLIYRGSTGDDYMYGQGDQPNHIDGLAGNDSITGGNLNDALAGGEGNDTLNGSYGNDTYLFNQGDGADTVSDYDYAADNTDTLSLGTGLTAELTRLGRVGNSLVLSWNGADSVTLQSYFSGSNYRVENIAFADGTSWDYAAVTNRLIYRGSTGDDYMYGLGDQPNHIDGLAGNDFITGGNLNDALAGGEGNDTLNGSYGNDTYLFNQGDGADTVSDYDYAADNTDTLSLGASLTAELTRLGRVGNSLVLSWNGTDSVTLQNYFYSSTYRIENIAFASGTTWDYAAVIDRLIYRGTTGDDYMYGLGDQPNHIDGLAGNDFITGGNLNDALAGGEGNDTLNGSYGNDTYLFNQGDGADTVSDYDYAADNADTLSLGSSLTAELTQLGRVGNSLVLSWNGTDSVTLQNYFYSSSYRIENIAFADGTNWDYAAIAGRLIYRGTIGDDYMYGLNDQPNHIDGLAGNDFISGGNLNDTLAGGEGNDTLNGGYGSDTYLFNQGDGEDTISDYDYAADTIDLLSFGAGVAADQIWFRQVGSNLELSIIGTTDKATISNWYSGNPYHVEQFRTSDGRALLDSQVNALVSAMAAFAPPVAGQTSLSADYQATLAPVIAANWTQG